MGIRSLLRKVFGRTSEPVTESSDTPSAALPSQTERTPLDAAAELVAASFDNPTVPPQSAPRDREPGTVLTAPAPAHTPDPTVPEARRSPSGPIPPTPPAEPTPSAEAEAEVVAEAAVTAPEADPAAEADAAAPQAQDEADAATAPEAEPLVAVAAEADVVAPQAQDEAPAVAPEAEQAAEATPEAEPLAAATTEAD
ncbi:hypothetical protein ACWGDE_19340, partial [Streptomyces sp. NPDC054956]